jgi:hypothetical protein
MVQYILGGSFPHVAAEAVGVPRALFEEWLKRGDAPDAHTLYRRFAITIREAAAKVRASAEAMVLNKRPLDWLKCGPGKETAESPGWSMPVRGWPAGAASADESADEPFEQLTYQLLVALTPHPDARVAAAGVLAPEEEGKPEQLRDDPKKDNREVRS